MSKGMLGNLRLSDVWGPVAALWENLAGDDGQRVLDELKRFVKKQPCWVPEGEAAKKPVKKPGVLVRDGSFSAVELTMRHDPRKFYQTRAGLYVWPDFVNWIVAAAAPSEAGRTFKKTSAWKLTKNATGEELRAARPKAVWTATDFCAWLSVKLAKQPNGEEGELLNTGWANLFLVEGVLGGAFVVFVGWLSVDREWFVRAWPLGSGWRAGHRFASKPI